MLTTLKLRSGFLDYVREKLVREVMLLWTFERNGESTAVGKCHNKSGRFNEVFDAKMDRLRVSRRQNGQRRIVTHRATFPE